MMIVASSERHTPGTGHDHSAGITARLGGTAFALPGTVADRMTRCGHLGCHADPRSGMASTTSGDMWPSSYALKELTAGTEARIAELVKRAVKRP
jgi:hypothetical protein